MGFFKKIGEKVKRAVSLNNGIKLLTGDFKGVAGDVVRIATTEKPVKGQPTQADTTFFKAPPEIPQPINDLLIVKGQEQTEKMVNKIAQKEEVQDNASAMTGLFSKVYLKAMWLKYKTWFIVGLCTLGAFLIYWFGFREKPQPKRRSAKGRR